MCERGREKNEDIVITSVPKENSTVGKTLRQCFITYAYTYRLVQNLQIHSKSFAGLHAEA